MMCDACEQWCVWAWGFSPKEHGFLLNSLMSFSCLLRVVVSRHWGAFGWLCMYHGTKKRRLWPENPWAHAHEHWSHASCIMHHVHCDCLAPQYWEYYPNIRLHYIGHPCHSSDFRRTPKPKLSSKQNRNLAAIWGLNKGVFNTVYI
jgi:hypothetical protein